MGTPCKIRRDAIKCKSSKNLRLESYKFSLIRDKNRTMGCKLDFNFNPALMLQGILYHLPVAMIIGMKDTGTSREILLVFFKEFAKLLGRFLRDCDLRLFFLFAHSKSNDKL